jgi:hypothetical protein
MCAARFAQRQTLGDGWMNLARAQQREQLQKVLAELCRVARAGRM